MPNHGFALADELRADQQVSAAALESETLFIISLPVPKLRKHCL